MPDSRDEIRAFVAVEIPESVKDFLRELVADLKRFGENVSWTRTEGIHVTLKFLGNVGRDLAPRIESELRAVFSPVTPFELHVRGLGAFPGLARPRVIWAGLRDDSGRLAALASKVETALGPLGFNRENRPFNPHLTLGRVKAGKVGPELISVIRRNLSVSGPSFPADHAILFQSILKPSGAQYIPLRRFDFAAGK